MPIQSNEQRADIAIFWKMSAALIVLIALWATAIAWPAALEYVFGVPAIITFILWAISAIEAYKAWRGGFY
jgi:hypothetical protein